MCHRITSRVERLGYVSYEEKVFGKKHFVSVFAPVHVPFFERKIRVWAEWVEIEYKVQAQDVELVIPTWNCGRYSVFRSVVAGAHIAPFGGHELWVDGLLVAGTRWDDVTFFDGIDISTKKVLIPRSAEHIRKILELGAREMLQSVESMCELIERWIGLIPSRGEYDEEENVYVLRK